MVWLKNLKFVRKIQGGFFILAFISTLIVVVGYTQLTKMSSTKDSIFKDYIAPQSQIQNIYSHFQKTQFIMLQFSMKEFASKFNDNVKDYELHKKSIDEAIETILKGDINDETRKNINEVKKIWIDYKTMVADAIMSASVTQMYEMAADIATSSGEEVGQKLVKKFDSINSELSAKGKELNSSADRTASAAILLTILGSILGTVVFCFNAFYLAPAITKPINKLKEIVKEFAVGNYDIKIKNDSQDEIGELTDLFITLQKAQVDKIYAAEQIAAGNMHRVKPASSKDDLANAFNKEVDIIESILNEANMLVEANKQGQLNLRGDVSKYSGGWGKLIEGVNSILDVFLAPIKEASEVLSIMASGDFTKKIQGDYKGDYKLIKDSVNDVADSLNEALSAVATSASAVASSSTQISSSSEEMAAGAQEQAQQAAEVAASVEEMTKTILESNKNAGIAAETSKSSSDNAKKGVQKVEETKKGIDKIVLSTEKTGVIITSLVKKTDQIGEITQVIDDIADQTNLLALNAAIEAARAGEQGRGFAVVADEVRKLAERTTKATKEIADTIKAIQNEAKEADKSMEDSNNAVKEGIKLTEEVAHSLREILMGADKVSDIVVQVASASEQQSASAEMISKNIEGINTVTQQTSDGINQIAKAAEDLSRLTVNLQELVGKFNIEGNSQIGNHFNRFEANDLIAPHEEPTLLQS
ncbi:MAG: methyl-accepting chemotaxis protein [Clostridiales bacterium]